MDASLWGFMFRKGSKPLSFSDEEGQKPDGPKPQAVSGLGALTLARVRATGRLLNTSIYMKVSRRGLSGIGVLRTSPMNHSKIPVSP